MARSSSDDTVIVGTSGFVDNVMLAPNREGADDERIGHMLKVTH